MKDIHVSILERLRYVKDGTTLAPISDLVGGRIFGEFADHGTKRPYLTFDHVSTASSRLGFGENNKMMHRANIVIRAYGEVEEGAESVCEIGDRVVESFNFYRDTSVTTFEVLNYKVTSGTTIERADDTVVAVVGLSAHGIQNSGV